MEKKEPDKKTLGVILLMIARKNCPKDDYHFFTIDIDNYSANIWRITDDGIVQTAHLELTRIEKELEEELCPSTNVH